MGDGFVHFVVPIPTIHVVSHKCIDGWGVGRGRVDF